MFRRVVRSEIEGEPDTVEYELYQLSSEEAHSCFHPPIRATIIADKIMHRMCTMMRQDPLQDAIILWDKVLSEDLLTLPEDDQRLVEKELPLRPEATINKINDLNDDVFTAPAPASRNTSASSAASVGRMSRPASTQAPLRLLCLCLKSDLSVRGPGVILVNSLRSLDK